MVCVVGRMRDLILQLSKSSIYSTKPPLELNDILAWQELRTLSKALTFQYDKVMYIIEPT